MESMSANTSGSNVKNVSDGNGKGDGNENI